MNLEVIMKLGLVRDYIEGRIEVKLFREDLRQLIEGDIGGDDSFCNEIGIAKPKNSDEMDAIINIIILNIMAARDNEAIRLYKSLNILSGYIDAGSNIQRTIGNPDWKEFTWGKRFFPKLHELFGIKHNVHTELNILLELHQYDVVGTKVFATINETEKKNHVLSIFGGTNEKLANGKPRGRATYFTADVISDNEYLLNVLKTFAKNPWNLRNFLQIVFKWKFLQTGELREKQEIDLLVEMGTFYFYSKETGPWKVSATTSKIERVEVKVQTEKPPTSQTTQTRVPSEAANADAVRRLVAELVSKPQYLHFGFGSFGSEEAIRRYRNDWTPLPIKGDLLYHPDLFSGYLNRLKRYREMEIEFEALKKKRFAFQFTIDKKERELQEAHPSERDEIKKILNKIVTEDPAYSFITTFRDWVQGDPEKQNAHDGKISLSLAAQRFSEFPEFLARFFGESIGSSYVFSIYYKSHDRSGRGTYISYGLAIPLNEKAVILQIAANPNLIIEIFRKAYPGADESGGSLRIMQERGNLKNLPS